MTIEIGGNLKEFLLALVALVGTYFGYYFGFKRGVSVSQIKLPEDKKQ